MVHKRAFVALDHNSLPSACSGVGHKGIAQYVPVGGSLSCVKHSCRSGVNLFCRFTLCSFFRCGAAATGGGAHQLRHQGLRGRLWGVPAGGAYPERKCLDRNFVTSTDIVKDEAVVAQTDPRTPDGATPESAPAGSGSWSRSCWLARNWPLTHRPSDPYGGARDGRSVGSWWTGD